MAFRFTRDSLDHVCEQMLGLGPWRPTMHTDDVDSVLEILGRCESHLERMYAIGALFRLEFLAGHRVEIWPCTVSVVGVLRRGLWFPEPWDGFRCLRCGCDGGPSGIVLVPQLPLQGRTWDFGLIASGSNGDPDGNLIGAVEIDGYRVHRGRRTLDVRARRALAAAGLDGFACYEESHHYCMWFDAVMHRYWQAGLWPDARHCSGAHACEVFIPGSSEAA